MLALHTGRSRRAATSSRPNPAIDFESSPFYVNRQLPDPGRRARPRRAGVSSFGMGGTNAHVVLEEAAGHGAAQPATPPRGPGSCWSLSARTADVAGRARRASSATGWTRIPSVDLADAAPNLRPAPADDPTGVASSPRTAPTRWPPLDSRRGSSPAIHPGGRRPRGVPLPRAGRAARWHGRRAVPRGADLPGAWSTSAPSCSATTSARPATAALPRARRPRGGASGGSTQPRLIQPALFVIETPSPGCCIAWGVPPDAMVGHSLGEYVAACLAGVFSLADALRLVCARGELVERHPAGAMLAVSLPETAVAPAAGRPGFRWPPSTPRSCACLSGDTGGDRGTPPAADRRRGRCRPLRVTRGLSLRPARPGARRVRRSRPPRHLPGTRAPRTWPT